MGILAQLILTTVAPSRGAIWVQNGLLEKSRNLLLSPVQLLPIPRPFNHCGLVEFSRYPLRELNLEVLHEPERWSKVAIESIVQAGLSNLRGQIGGLNV